MNKYQNQYEIANDKDKIINVHIKLYLKIIS